MKNLTEEEKDLIRMFREGYKGIYWHVNDFESKAQDIEEDEDILFDRTMFPLALERMINEHDCGNGINWETVTQYLWEICEIKN